MSGEDELRNRVLELVQKVRYGHLPDEDASEVLSELERLIPYPDWVEVLFLRIPELTDQEAIDVAMAYKPFAL